MGGCDDVEGNGMKESKQVTCVNCVVEEIRWGIQAVLQVGKVFFIAHRNV